jgi:MOSC domain
LSEIAAQRIEARVALCLIADGDDFISYPVGALTVDFAGIVGDHHAGRTRRSGSREPWYPRGTEIRNDRQITIVSSVELAEVAEAMKLPVIEPGWIGANLVFSDLPDLTGLPPGTKMLFEGGATLAIERENGPCRIAGGSIARHFPDREGIDLEFSKAARHKRGLVASVEKSGMITIGEAVTVHVPMQRPYQRGDS